MTIKKIVVSVLALGIAGVVGSGIIGCSTTSERDYRVKSSDGDEYVYIVDYEKIALIEKASRTSHANVDTVWVNPPYKRIKKSELEEMRKKQ